MSWNEQDHKSTRKPAAQGYVGCFLWGVSGISTICSGCRLTSFPSKNSWSSWGSSLNFFFTSFFFFGVSGLSSCQSGENIFLRVSLFTVNLMVWVTLLNIDLTFISVILCVLSCKMKCMFSIFSAFTAFTTLGWIYMKQSLFHGL